MDMADGEIMALAVWIGLESAIKPFTGPPGPVSIRLEVTAFRRHLFGNFGSRLTVEPATPPHMAQAGRLRGIYTGYMYQTAGVGRPDGNLTAKRSSRVNDGSDRTHNIWALMAARFSA